MYKTRVLEVVLLCAELSEMRAGKMHQHCSGLGSNGSRHKEQSRFAMSHKDFFESESDFLSVYVAQSTRLPRITAFDSF
jgi:hypothetical protein